MPTRFSEFQRIYAAIAAAPDRFCVAIHEMDVDDPFSIIIEYDGAFAQPWSRTEVRRNVFGVTARPDSEHGSRPYVAISDEGAVFFLDEGGVRTEKIRGAGVYSADADGSGAMSGLALVDGVLHAYGAGGQLYRRGATDWERLPIGDPKAAKRGAFAFLLPIGEQSALLGGAVAAESWTTPEDIQRARMEAAASGDFERFQELSQEAERWADGQGVARVPSGLLLNGRGGDWRAVDINTEQILTAAFAETPEQVWIVGTGGLMLVGNTGSGFSDQSFVGDRDQNLVSITRFAQKTIVASDYSLHTFDGHLLSSLKPVLDPSVNSGTPTPFKVQVAGDAMFYFDYKHGVLRWDGEIWDEIPIPDELLARDFTGLPLRQ